jgi:hypothetical protein
LRAVSTLATCVVLACLTASAAESLTTMALGRVQARADTDLGPITRDGGFSVQYSSQPPRSLWLFGDTSQKNGPRFIGGTTAAIASVVAGQAPTDLVEIPTPPMVSSSPPQSPQPFFPSPEGLEAPGSKARSTLPCGGQDSGSLYPAAWPVGGAQIPGSSRVLLVYQQVCVTSKGFPIERLTLTIYDPQHNQFAGFWTPFVARPLSAALGAREVLESPIFGGDGYLYLFAHELGGVYVARVNSNPTAWGSASNYSWWTAPNGNDGRWTADEAAATSLVNGLRVLGISAGNYAGTTLHKFVLLIQTGFRTADFALFEAPTPTGPWTAGPTGRVPDACNVGIFGCYSLNGHPELSTQQQLVYSWYSPGEAEGQGRVNVGALRW